MINGFAYVSEVAELKRFEFHSEIVLFDLFGSNLILGNKISEKTLLHPDRLQHKKRRRTHMRACELLVKMPKCDWFVVASSIRRIKINSLMQILLTNKLEANLNRIKDQKCKFSRSLLFFSRVPDARPMMIAYDTIFFILFIFIFLHSDSLLFLERSCGCFKKFNCVLPLLSTWLNMQNDWTLKFSSFLAAKHLATCADSYCSWHHTFNFSFEVDLKVLEAI